MLRGCRRRQLRSDVFGKFRVQIVADFDVLKHTSEFAGEFVAADLLERQLREVLEIAFAYLQFRDHGLFHVDGYRLLIDQSTREHLLVELQRTTWTLQRATNGSVLTRWK